jgi:hypothetical protein
MDIGNLILFIVACAAVAGVILWLQRSNQREQKRMGQMLGMTVNEDGPVEEGDDPARRGYRWQKQFLSGTLHGHPATAWSRHWRLSKKTPSNRAGHMCVLAFALPQPSPVQMVIEPMILGLANQVLLGGWHTVYTLDEAFEKAWRVSSPQADLALAALTPAVRKALLDFHAVVGGVMPDNAGGAMSKAVLQGTFEVEAGRVTYFVAGTSRAEVATAFRQAAPVLGLLSSSLSK